MNRSHRTWLSIAFVIAFGGFPTTVGRLNAREGVPKPNVLIIYADDLGYGDVQCYNPQRGKIPTPQIDRLATQGMRFVDAHSSSGVCSPSRYALHIYRFDGDTLKLPPLPSKVLSAKCLTGGEAAFEQTEGSLTVKVPAAQQQEIDTLVALELDRPAMDLDPIDNASKRRGR